MMFSSLGTAFFADFAEELFCRLFARFLGRTRGRELMQFFFRPSFLLRRRLSLFYPIIFPY
jgi:hypothetical protein